MTIKRKGTKIFAKEPSIELIVSTNQKPNSGISMNNISGVKNNKISFITNSSLTTLGDNINQHIKYVLTISNSYQPLWSPNIQVTEPLLSSSQLLLLRSKTRSINIREVIIEIEKPSSITQMLLLKTQHA